MKMRAASALLLCVCALAAPPPAAADPVRLGETFLVTNAVVRGTAVAYDWKNDVYLVVSGHGAVLGRFVSGDGTPLGNAFQFQSTVFWGQFPQAAYSPDADNGNGGFLVTWHESDGAAPSVHGRMVGYNSGLLSDDRRLTPNDTYWEIMGPPVAYSTVSHEFLVVWRAYFAVDILGLRVGNNGVPLGQIFGVAATTAFESSPSIAYNSAEDEFFVLYSSGVSSVTALGQRIQPGADGAQIGGPFKVWACC
jgi:hypothetical protein